MIDRADRDGREARRPRTAEASAAAAQKIVERGDVRPAPIAGRRSRRAARPTGRCPALRRTAAPDAIAAEPLLPEPQGPLLSANRPRTRLPHPEMMFMAANIEEPHRKTVASRSALPMSPPMADPVDPLTDLPHDRADPLAQADRRRCDDHRGRNRTERRRSGRSLEQRARDAALAHARRDRGPRRADRRASQARTLDRHRQRQGRRRQVDRGGESRRRACAGGQEGRPDRRRRLRPFAADSARPAREAAPPRTTS